MFYGHSVITSYSIHYTKLYESQLGKEKVDTMTFSESYDEIILQQNQTFEFKRICIEEDKFPVGYFIDVREPLVRILV